MVKFALLARLEAKPGKEETVENFLKSALPVAEDERDNRVICIKNRAIHFWNF